VVILWSSTQRLICPFPQTIGYEDRFVSYFVDRFMLYGTVTTSRNHSEIKSYLNLGNINILRVLKALDLLLDNQMTKLQAFVEQDMQCDCNAII
jgi:hypothetical protein